MGLLFKRELSGFSTALLGGLPLRVLWLLSGIFLGFLYLSAAFMGSVGLLAFKGSFQLRSLCSFKCCFPGVLKGTTGGPSGVLLKAPLRVPSRTWRRILGGRLRAPSTAPPVEVPSRFFLSGTLFRGL